MTPAGFSWQKGALGNERKNNSGGMDRRIGRESSTVKSKPDLMLIVMAAFGVGVLLTLMLPAANNSVAEPVSALQAGVLIDD